MSPTRKGLAGIAAALTTFAIAVAAPVSSASAGVVGGGGVIAATGWGGTPAALIGGAGPGIGQSAIVIGPAIITTAPSSFINTSNQVTAAGAWSGGQLTVL